MKEVKLIRVDQRLIHGQVVTAWIKSSGCNTIVVADDAAAKDPLSETLFKLALPRGIGLKIVTVDDLLSYLNNEGNERILLIFGNLQNLERAIDQGVLAQEVNVGNISQAAGKRQYFKSIFLDDSDLASIRRLTQQGIRLFVQVVPGENKIPIQKIVKGR